MSLVLRHQPEYLNLSLDEDGYCAVDALIKGINTQKLYVDLAIIKTVVEENDKKRFSFNSDFTKIRANQGHSVDVDLHLAPKEPPAVLYHGTVAMFINAIKVEGLKKGSRQHVHLSAEMETARIVATRRGIPIILRIRALEMHRAGHSFYMSDNGVWLVELVPMEYIEF